LEYLLPPKGCIFALQGSLWYSKQVLLNLH
jgi:hypothetical protein